MKTSKSKRKQRRSAASHERLRHLAPLEQQRGAVDGAGGERVLRANTGALRLPEGFGEADDGPWWLPGRVFLVVAGLALAFTLAIAWLVGTGSAFVAGEGWKMKVGADSGE